MKPVFGLVEYHRPGVIQKPGGNFLAVVSWQGMHEQNIPSS
jgi:hypothetical protein